MAVELKVWDRYAAVEDAAENMPANGLIVIASSEQYVAYANRLKLVKAFQSHVTEWFRGSKDKPGPLTRAYQSYQQLLDREKAALAPANVEEPILKSALLAWDEKLDAERRQRERELAEQARRDEEERRLADAAALDEAARHDSTLAVDAAEAYAAFDQPIQTQGISVPSLRPKVDGIVYKDNWKARQQVDLKKLAAGVASGKYPTSYISANFTALNAKARSCAGTEAVDGVTFYNDRGLASGKK